MRLSAPIYHLKRKAKRLSREEGIPLHDALDRVATAEGFSAWSLLAAKAAGMTPAGKLFPQFRPGELVLLGARPGHGKTLMSLELAVEAMRKGGRAAFSRSNTPRETFWTACGRSAWSQRSSTNCSSSIAPMRSAPITSSSRWPRPARHIRGDRLSATARPAAGKPRPDRSGARAEIVRTRQGADRRLHLADRSIL